MKRPLQGDLVILTEIMQTASMFDFWKKLRRAELRAAIIPRE